MSNKDRSRVLRKSRGMSEERKRRSGGGRKKLVDRKPSEGRAELKLRLPDDVKVWVDAKGRQAYVLGLIREDMERQQPQPPEA